MIFVLELVKCMLKRLLSGLFSVTELVSGWVMYDLVIYISLFHLPFLV